MWRLGSRSSSAGIHCSWCREGFVTGLRLPDARCVGGKLLAIGETYETVVLSDGTAPSRTIELPESRWDELEILP
jgi:hypothetical protein